MESWEIVPKLEVGDPESTPIYAAVGRACSTWEGLENFLSLIYAELCPTDRGAAQAAYGVVMSAMVRLDMILAASVYSVEGEIAAEVQALVETVKKLAPRRNDIVHGSVMGFVSGDPPVDHGFFLTPRPYRTRGWAPHGSVSPDDPQWKHFKYAYTSDQVLAYVAAFTEATKQASRLLARLQTSKQPQG